MIEILMMMIMMRRIMKLKTMETENNNLTLRCAATVELATSPRRLALGCAA